MRLIHNEELPPHLIRQLEELQARRKAPCQFCKKTFTQVGSKNRHEDVVHINPKNKNKVPKSKEPKNKEPKGKEPSDGGFGGHQLVWVGASERDGHQDLHIFTDSFEHFLRKAKVVSAHLLSICIFISSS